MDLAFTPHEQAFRAELRRWLETNLPREPFLSGDTPEGFAQGRQWERKLFDARWAVVSWPEKYGGRGASLIEWLIFEEEYWRSGAPQRVTQNGIFLLAPTLFEFATDAQKDRYLSKMAAAEEVWAQGWSEPGAGSDLAGLKSKAVRDDARGGWRLTGQKTWCTRAAYCDYVFGLFRTDPNAERHKGLTYFLVPLNAPGVTVRPVARLDGDPGGFAEVFFDEAFVTDADAIGGQAGINRGWHMAMATASSERGLTLRSPGRFLATVDRLVDLYRRMGAGAPPALRDSVIQLWIEAQAYSFHTYQAVAQLDGGKPMGPEASLMKIFWSELDVRIHETALALLGSRAELIAEAPEAVDGGAWMKGFQFALAGPIYAGTNEIQRNVVAERVLGLPRK